MSLMAKLTQSWNDDVDGVYDALVDNICDLLSSRAPMWANGTSAGEGTIVELGTRNIARVQCKANTGDIVAEIEKLVRCYEPRLSGVDVEVQEGKVGDNQLSFRLSAVVHSDIGDEAIVLDSCLDLSTNKLEVRTSSFV